MSRWFKLALIGLALVLIGLSANRYLSGGGIDWFSLGVSLAALALLLAGAGQGDGS